MHSCNIVDNPLFALQVISNDNPINAIDATDNYWGSDDLNAIEDMIFHRLDNPAFPMVDYLPYAYSEFDLDDSIITDVPDMPHDGLPSGFHLSQNYPNPFNSSTTIAYTLPVASRVRLTIFNILGQRVKTLVDGDQSAGSHTVSWNGTNSTGRAVATGIYMYQIQANEFVRSRKMVLIE